MTNYKINQEIENIINLMGEDVSFEFQDKHHSQKIQGQVTDIVLSLDGNHQFSIEGGGFFVIADVDFKVLDSDPVADAFEALITDNKDFIDSLSKPTL